MAIKHVRNFLQAHRLKDYIAHRRILLFWAVAVLSLTVPWAVPGAGPGTFALARREVLEDCKVLNIHDGDTMTVLCGQHTDRPRRIKVRLYCIDAPEMGQRPWGRQARDYLRSITPMRVTLVAMNRDRYGRTVGEVLAIGESRRNINLVMVAAGQAAVYPRYCSDQRYIQAERKTRKIRAGIWAKSGLHQRPWGWRVVR